MLGSACQCLMSLSHNSRKAPLPPFLFRTRSARLRTSGCESAGAAKKPTRSSTGRSLISFPTYIVSSGWKPRFRISSRKAAALSSIACRTGIFSFARAWLRLISLFRDDQSLHGGSRSQKPKPKPIRTTRRRHFQARFDRPERGHRSSRRQNPLPGIRVAQERAAVVGWINDFGR